MIRIAGLVVLLAFAVSGCQGSVAPTVAPPPVLAWPGVTGPSFAPGGSLRGGSVDVTRPLPPAGYGLYVYVLPERGVSAAMLDALLKFHDCLSPPGTADHARSVALLLLPIKRGPDGDHISVELAHDFLRALPVPDIDNQEVYFVATNRPLQLHAATGGTTIIRLGRIAPRYVASWLIDFQNNIESGGGHRSVRLGSIDQIGGVDHFISGWTFWRAIRQRGSLRVPMTSAASPPRD